MSNLLQLMEQSGLNRNQISKISGISNTFLSKVERTEEGGKRIEIKRKTLISIAVSLNLSLVEINSLLVEYGHSEVSASDIPYFLTASENQSVTGILPLFSSLALEWFLIGMEKRLSATEGASLIWVLDQPSHAFKSPEHASFLDELNTSERKVSPVHRDLVESACVHRRKLITEALERGNKISTYICAGCLERYMRGWERHKGTDIEGTYKTFLREHMQTLIHYIETYPDRYRVALLRKCPRMRYELLYLPTPTDKGGVDKTISKVFFLGHESDCFRGKRIMGGSNDFGFGQGFGDLIGFATDLQGILDFFHKQHAGLAENFADNRFENPLKMAEHIKELVSQNIPDSNH